MSLVLLIYLADVVGGIKLIFIGAGSVVIMSGILGAPLFFEFIEEKPLLKAIKIGIPLAILSIFIGTLMPSKKTIYIMAGVHYGTQALESSKVSAIGEKAYKLLEKKIDEALEDKK